MNATAMFEGKLCCRG